jgi:hypothetical protein
MFAFRLPRFPRPLTTFAVGAMNGLDHKVKRQSSNFVRCR